MNKQLSLALATCLLSLTAISVSANNSNQSASDPKRSDADRVLGQIELGSANKLEDFRNKCPKAYSLLENFSQNLPDVEIKTKDDAATQTVLKTKRVFEIVKKAMGNCVREDISSLLPKEYQNRKFIDVIQLWHQRNSGFLGLFRADNEWKEIHWAYNMNLQHKLRDALRDQCKFNPDNNARTTLGELSKALITIFSDEYAKLYVPNNLWKQYLKGIATLGAIYGAYKLKLPVKIAGFTRQLLATRVLVRA